MALFQSPNPLFGFGEQIKKLRNTITRCLVIIDMCKLLDLTYGQISLSRSLYLTVLFERVGRVRTEVVLADGEWERDRPYWWCLLPSTRAWPSLTVSVIIWLLCACVTCKSMGVVPFYAISVEMSLQTGDHVFGIKIVTSGKTRSDNAVLFKVHRRDTCYRNLGEKKQDFTIT